MFKSKTKKEKISFRINETGTELFFFFYNLHTQYVVYSLNPLISGLTHGVVLHPSAATCRTGNRFVLLPPAISFKGKLKRMIVGSLGFSYWEITLSASEISFQIISPECVSVISIVLFRVSPTFIWTRLLPFDWYLRGSEEYYYKCSNFSPDELLHPLVPMFLGRSPWRF